MHAISNSYPNEMTDMSNYQNFPQYTNHSNFIISPTTTNTIDSGQSVQHTLPSSQISQQLPTQPPPVYATREDQQTLNQPTTQSQLNQQTQWNTYGQKNPVMNQMSNPTQQNQPTGPNLNNIVNNNVGNRLHQQIQTRHSDTDAMMTDNDDEFMAGNSNLTGIPGLGLLNGNNSLSANANYNRMRQLQQWTQQSASNMRYQNHTSSPPGYWKRFYTFIILIGGIVIIGFIVLSPLFHYFM